MEAGIIPFVYNLEVEDTHNYFAAGVLVSNCHMFKNLAMQSRHTRLPGLGGQAGADRSMDMFLKTQHVMEKNNGRGFIGMTGTPVSNSLTEMYTLMRYFMNPKLKKMGLGRVDNWLQTFANIETAMEAAPEGGYRERSRVRDYCNTPEMTRMYREFADVRTAEDLNLPVPEVHGGGPENVIAEQSGPLSHFMQELRERALVLTGQRGKVPDPREDNFLKMMTEARKGSLDMRLLNGYENLPDDPTSKVNLCVGNVLEDYKTAHAYRGTQMVFLDMSTPKGKVEGTEHPHVTAVGAVAYNVALGEGQTEKEAQQSAKDAKRLKKADMKATDRARKEAAKTGAAVAKTDAETEARENGLPHKEIKAAGKQAAAEYLTAFEAEHDDPGRMDEPDGDELEDETEQKEKFQVYGDIKNKLMAAGIPEHEIAFAHDYDTDARKNEMREKMNDGTIRVLLGSTGKMGAGLNAQERLYSLHHLDCPWKPADLEQREGRIIRQGNIHKKMGIPVRIRRYATKGSLDEFMWQQIENKSKFIRQARTGTFEGRRMDDIGDAEMQAAAMKVASSDSPEMARLNEAKIRESQLGALRRAHINERDGWSQRVGELPGEIALHHAMSQKARAHAAQHAEYSAGKLKFAMTVGGESFDKREDAGKALHLFHRKKTKDEAQAVAGNYGPFQMRAARNIDPFSGANHVKVNLHDASGAHVASVAASNADGFTDSGLTSSIDHALRALPKVAESHEEQARAKQSELQDLQGRLAGGENFEGASEHGDIKREIAVLEAKQRARKKAMQSNMKPDEVEAEVAKAGAIAASQ